MMDCHSSYERAISLIDAVNAEDPRRVMHDGDVLPKEMLYSMHMTDMLDRFAPQTDDVLRLAVRAQHVQRWKIPRADYPGTRDGYYQWRSHLYRFHADVAGNLLRDAGYDEAVVSRIAVAISKRDIKTNPDAQLIEDVASLVFLEHYLAEFFAQHPDYDETRWIGLLSRTWRKMSPAGRHFAQTAIRFPDALSSLIQQVVLL